MANALCQWLLNINMSMNMNMMRIALGLMAPIVEFAGSESAQLL
jgi:hypothetical protein